MTNIAARQIQRLAERIIQIGSLTMELPSGRRLEIVGREPGPNAVMMLHDEWVPFRFLTHGSIGLGGSYIEGLWDTPNIYDVCQLLFVNLALKGYKDGMGAWLSRALFGLTHTLRWNSRSGSKRNVMAHYDLGNEFYQLWLDETMTYSSAIYNSPEGLSLDNHLDNHDERSVTGIQHRAQNLHGSDNTKGSNGSNGLDKVASSPSSNKPDLLAQAQRMKYQRILAMLERGQRVTEQREVLEIGCGWGGFMEHAVAKGHRVQGVTISPAQAIFARERMRNLNVSGEGTIVERDYRDLEGLFDAIVSIEMFEALGPAYWSTYFRKMASLLKDNGRAVVQAILIEGTSLKTYLARSDFIRHYIFPGGSLINEDAFTHHAMQSDLRVMDTFRFGKDYSKTLLEWDRRFHMCRDSVLAQGFDMAFIRKWHFYLQSCAAAFDAGYIDVAQFTLDRARR